MVQPNADVSMLFELGSGIKLRGDCVSIPLHFGEQGKATGCCWEKRQGACVVAFEKPFTLRK